MPEFDFLFNISQSHVHTSAFIAQGARDHAPCLPRHVTDAACEKSAPSTVSDVFFLLLFFFFFLPIGPADRSRLALARERSSVQPGARRAGQAAKRRARVVRPKRRAAAVKAAFSPVSSS